MRGGEGGAGRGESGAVSAVVVQIYWRLTGYVDG